MRTVCGCANNGDKDSMRWLSRKWKQILVSFCELRKNNVQLRYWSGK